MAEATAMQTSRGGGLRRGAGRMEEDLMCSKRRNEWRQSRVSMDGNKGRSVAWNLSVRIRESLGHTTESRHAYNEGQRCNCTGPVRYRQDLYDWTLCLPDGRHGFQRALILSPTRELSALTENVRLAIGEFINIQAHACIGGKSVGEDIRKLENGVHIVSGTPGRLSVI
ncbi:hypothetical protein Patl1_16343 [Pistacia atlantica]|uniref:Uncharacterized protein n=1 Tax=Pistacia atlantica TaxID=434234 RepID=A0ACC1B920_9ROSI|nr:hypothetical protein Patl1_16343 [Pistacia atlantica]